MVKWKECAIQASALGRKNKPDRQRGNEHEENAREAAGCFVQNGMDCISVLYGVDVAGGR